MKSEVRNAFMRTLAWFANNPSRWTTGKLTSRPVGNLIKDDPTACYCLAGKFALELNEGQPLNAGDIESFLLRKTGLSYGQIFHLNDSSNNANEMIDRAKRELV